MTLSRGNLFTTDRSVTLVIAHSRELDQIRVTSRAWDEPQVFKQGEVLELRCIPQGIGARRGFDPPEPPQSVSVGEVDPTPVSPAPTEEIS